MIRPRRVLDAVVLLCLLWLAWRVLDWAVLQAVFTPDLAACRALDHAGACWGVVAAKWRPMLFGHFPFEDQWRPAIASLLMVVCTFGAAGAIALRAHTAARSRSLAGLALAGWGVSVALLRGGWAGLAPVQPEQWGGLPLTLLLSIGAWCLAWPVGIGLAYGRRARWAILSVPCTAVIEVVRGAPLVIWLFAAAFALPAALPAAWTPGLLPRVLLVLGVFAGAYLAEILRGGLQTVPAEQTEAARVLGLGWWGIQRRIVLPQAVRATLPPLVSHAIGLLKDTSLVMVIGLHELSGALGLAIGGDADWRPFYVEAYLSVAALYFALCVTLARLGRRLEHRLCPPTV